MPNSGLSWPFNLTSILLTIFLAFGFLHAQEAKLLPRHPGDIIKFEIKFDGPNAARVTTVVASVSTREGVPKDQAGFTNGFGTDHPFSPSSPNTFIVEIKVPNNCATGNYFLTITANASEGGRANYSSGQEFSVPPIAIENPQRFTPPEIIVKPLP